MVQNIANSNCKNVKNFDISARIKRFQFFYVELKLKFDQNLKIVIYFILHILDSKMAPRCSRSGRSKQVFYAFLLTQVNHDKKMHFDFSRRLFRLFCHY